MRVNISNLLPIIEAFATNLNICPTGPVQMRAPLIPVETPKPDFDRLRRKGPNPMLLRKKNPICARRGLMPVEKRSEIIPVEETYSKYVYN